jgi:hypothetical protein
LPSATSSFSDLAGDLADTTSTFSTVTICEIGANSFMSYGNSLNSEGLTAALPTGTTASVWPSGADFAT